MRTVVNVEAGGRSRFSGVIHGLFLAAVQLGLSGLVQHVPRAVLAGLLVPCSGWASSTTAASAISSRCHGRMRS